MARAEADGRLPAAGDAAGAAVVRPAEVAATMRASTTGASPPPPPPPLRPSPSALPAPPRRPLLPAVADGAADRLERRRASRARSGAAATAPVNKQVAAGWRGAAAAARSYVTLRVAVAAVARRPRTAGAAAAAALPDGVVVAVAAAAAAVGGWVGRELTAVGAARPALADDFDAVARASDGRRRERAGPG